MSEPDQAQLARELEEQLKSLRVEDVLVQSLVTVSSIGFRRLGLSQDTRDDRELEQSQLAIETMEALTPVLERFLPEQLASDFKGSAAQLKLAYVRAVGEDKAGAAAEPESEAEAGADSDAEPEPEPEPSPSLSPTPRPNRKPSLSPTPSRSPTPSPNRPRSSPLQCRYSSACSAGQGSTSS